MTARSDFRRHRHRHGVGAATAATASPAAHSPWALGAAPAKTAWMRRACTAFTRAGTATVAAAAARAVGAHHRTTAAAAAAACH